MKNSPHESKLFWVVLDMMNKMCSYLPVAILSLLLAGCQDVGPVGMYSKALFNKDVQLPDLVVSQVQLSPAPFQGVNVYMQVSLANDGGSSTLGYVQAD